MKINANILEMTVTEKGILKELYDKLKDIDLLYVTDFDGDQYIKKILEARGFDLKEGTSTFVKVRKYVGRVLAIDFDGTIVEHDFPDIGKIKPYAKEVINRLYDEGYYICIWSCRTGQELMNAKRWLKENDISYHKFNEAIATEAVNFSSSPKIYANCYIDDSNIGGLPEWTDIYCMITGKEFEL